MARIANRSSSFDDRRPLLAGASEWLLQSLRDGLSLIEPDLWLPPMKSRQLPCRLGARASVYAH